MLDYSPIGGDEEVASPARCQKSNLGKRIHIPQLDAEIQEGVRDCFHYHSVSEDTYLSALRRLAEINIL
jgi:hypothetical protein